MMILALLLLFAPPFSNEFGGLVGVHGFYLPGVAPQGTIFLSLFVLFFFFECVLNVVKRQRVKSRTRSLGSQNDADLFLSFSLSLLKLLRPMKQFYDAHCLIKQITRKTTSCS